MKRIKIDGIIQSNEKSSKIWLDYYRKLLNGDKLLTTENFNNNNPYVLETVKGLAKIANNKSVGVDRVPGEWIKIRFNKESEETNKLKIQKLEEIFRMWIEKNYIPDFWMKSKLILISKKENNIPNVENTRPISVLPSITKAFEVAIINNLEKIAYEQHYISEYQRGFTPRKSTLQNINDLFEFWQEIKESRKRTKLSMALIFIDLQRAYDWVNRSILLNLLKEAQIPGKIIEIIKIMMLKSSVTIDEVSEWKKSRGLIQGSWLSPILFNFYINPLLKKLENDNTWFRAYADDIVLAVETKEIDNKLSKILEWWKLFEIKLNPHKSGIMRILNKSGKVKGIKNAANIPEVGKYKYLGITINQSLNFKDIIELISKRTKYMKYQLRKIKHTWLSPRARRILLKSIYIQIISYACTSLFTRHKSYRNKLETAIYQLTKQIYGIRGNPKREKLYEAVDIPWAEELVRTRNMKQAKNKYNSEVIKEWYRTSTIINYAIGTTLLDCKWKNWKWNWGIITDHTHLTTSCPKLAEWRVKTIKHFEIWKIEDLAEILKERGIKRKKLCWWK